MEMDVHTTHTHTITCPGRDAVICCIRLKVKAYDRSEDHERPDCDLQQVTQPAPQLGV